MDKFLAPEQVDLRRDLARPSSVGVIIGVTETGSRTALLVNTGNAMCWILLLPQATCVASAVLIPVYTWGGQY